MRRAVSSIYYALFHVAVRTVALTFAGTNWRTDRFYLVYRSVEHKTVRDLCIEIAKPIPKAKLKTWFPPNGFSTNLKKFAELYLEMYERRVRADYDPRAASETSLFSKNSVQEALKDARSAIAGYWAATTDERALFATLLSYPAR